MDTSKWAMRSKTTWGNFTTAAMAIAAIFQIDVPSAEQFADTGKSLEQIIMLGGVVVGFLLNLYGRAKAQAELWWFKKPAGSGTVRAHWLLIPLAAVLVIGLAGCPGQVQTVKDQLTEETKAKLTPRTERFILLADIKSWTGVANAYSARAFCPQPPGTTCAEKGVVIALDQTLSRMRPAVDALGASAGGGDILTYLGIANALLLQLQADLASVLAEEAS